MTDQVQKIIDVLNDDSKPSITVQVVEGKVLVDYNLSAGIDGESLAFLAASLVISSYDVANMAAGDAAKATPPAAPEEFAAVFKEFLNGTRELPASEIVSGAGRRSFHVRLTGASRTRWVRVSAYQTVGNRHRTVLVRVT